MKREFEVPIETKKFCRSECPLAAKRGRYCSTCPSKEAKIKMWERIDTPAGKKLVALPSGDREKVLSILTTRKIKIVDKRPRPKFRTDLRWRGKLRKKGDVDDKGRPFADQRGMVRAWRDHVDSGESGGTIISPPRSGKCVYGDTLVRTYDGLVRIDSLFAKFPVGIERVGRFGHVYTPYGMREVRGLYSKVVDRTVEILFQSGTRLGGTENHPIAVVGGPSIIWTTLGELRGDEQILLPTCIPTEIDGRQLSVDDAVIVGAIATRASRDLLSSGIVSVVLDGLRNADAVRSAFYRRYRVSPNAAGRLVTALTTVAKSHPVDTELCWIPRDVYRAGPAATQALLRTVLDGATVIGDYRVAVIPRSLAEVVHTSLLGYGVWATVEHHSGGSHLAVSSSYDLGDMFWNAPRWAVENENDMPDMPVGLVDRVLSVKFVSEPRVVYDLAVPSVKCFVTNSVASHNTVIGVRCSLLHRERTFITASQIDFLRQFGMRYGENSNAIELYKRGKRPIVIVDKKGWKDAHKYGIHAVKKWGRDTERADIVLSTYQQFIHPERGHERLRKYIDGKFGTAEVDEQHQANAAAFSRVLNRINVRRKLGLTATVHRKDKMEGVTAAIIGKIVAKGKSVSTLPRLELFETGVHAPRNYKSWNGIVKFLSNSPERNKILVRQIFKDLRSDEKACVVIPVMRVSQVHELVKLVNQQGEYCRQYKNESWPRDLAVAYYGKTDTGAVLSQIRAGKARVVIANVRMVQLGLDVARWTHVYIGAVPTSNAMLTWQLINRVCTPYDAKLKARIGDKPQPVARLIIDSVSASVYCFSAVFKEKLYGYRAGIAGTNFIEAKTYSVARDQLARMEYIAAYPKLYSEKDAGVEAAFVKNKYGKERKRTVWNPGTKGITRF